MWNANRYLHRTALLVDNPNKLTQYSFYCSIFCVNCFYFIFYLYFFQYLCYCSLFRTVVLLLSFQFYVCVHDEDHSYNVIFIFSLYFRSSFLVAKVYFVKCYLVYCFRWKMCFLFLVFHVLMYFALYGCSCRMANKNFMLLIGILWLVWFRLVLFLWFTNH